MLDASTNTWILPPNKTPTIPPHPIQMVKVVSRTMKHKNEFCKNVRKKEGNVHEETKEIAVNEEKKNYNAKQQPVVLVKVWLDCKAVPVVKQQRVHRVIRRIH